MRVLAAFNAFKGTLTAAEAGGAAALGLRRALPGARVEVLPIADGGDGLLDALAPALGGEFRRSRVSGPLGGRLDARWLLAGRTAVIEMAEAAGLRHGGRLRPLDASTCGVGELMLAAAGAGAREIIVGLGGSASSDGGAGCAQAFGFELLDARGRPVRRGAAGLADLAEIRTGRGPDRLKGLRVTGLADVRNPLCGPRGSAAVFGPQKGAGPAQVSFIGRALVNYARVVRRCLGAGIARLPGGAAAGGLGAGLAAFFGAELADGSAYVLGRVGFAGALRRADLLLTGEGRFDRQTFYGKAPGAALAAARAAGVPAAVICGSSGYGGRLPPGRGLLAVAESGRYGRDAAAVARAAAGLAPSLGALLKKV